jgi:soluble lytic murein transglycosylase
VTGKVDPQWISEAQDLWRKNGKSLPDGCDAFSPCCRRRVA